MTVALGLQTASGQHVLDDVARRLGKVHSLSVTLTTRYIRPERVSVERFTVMRGGYLRYEQADSVILTSPETAWVLLPKRKLYQSKVAPPKNAPQNPFIGMPGLFGEKPAHALGPAGVLTWHGLLAYRIKVAPDSGAPKNSQLFLIIDKQKELPLGFDLQQNRFGVEGFYSSLTLDPPVNPSLFQFKPGKDWKMFRVKE